MLWIKTHHKEKINQYKIKGTVAHNPQVEYQCQIGHEKTWDRNRRNKGCVYHVILYYMNDHTGLANLMVS